MEDVQSRHDDRRIPIDEVGVSNLRYPIIVLDRARGEQQTIAQIAMSVSLPHHLKGTHMSRFLEVLNEHRGELTMRTLCLILERLRVRLEAERARIEVAFPYFIEREAPVTGAKALMDYACTFLAERRDRHDDFRLRVEVPVTTLCPCSKAISDYGAHNQRGRVTIDVRSAIGVDGQPALIWIEELIDIAERSASAPIYPLLKRPDERHVTMQAFDNPVFVEDVVRKVALELQADARVARFRVRAVNEESIHNHNAFARVDGHGAAEDRTHVALVASAIGTA
jgi:GTP cyclohydrolase I